MQMRTNKKNERGATLIALLALMAIVAVLALAAAPGVYYEVQRDKELEAIRRGEEVAEAIRLYVQYSSRLPDSMDELLEGVSVQGRTKKLQILRQAAAKDPLSKDGEWKLVKPNDKAMADFYARLRKYSGGAEPPSPPPFVAQNNPNGQQQQQQQNPQIQVILSQVRNNPNSESTEEEEPPGGEDTSDTGDADFIGVVSRSQRKSFLSFYGIERHDRWIFTPLFRGTGN